MPENINLKQSSRQIGWLEYEFSTAQSILIEFMGQWHQHPDFKYIWKKIGLLQNDFSILNLQTPLSS